MHEGVYTEQIVAAILEGLQAHPQGRVLCARVSVGEMLHLAPDAVQMHFASLAKGGRLEGATLELKEEKVLIKCQDCSAESRPEDHHHLACAKCGSHRATVLAGRGVRVESVDLED